MVELLAGALIGDMFSLESSANDTHRVGAPFGGELILAIDPGHCNGSADHLSRAEYLFDEVLSQPGTRLPSQRRYTARQRNIIEGVDVSTTLLDQLEQLKHNKA